MSPHHAVLYRGRTLIDTPVDVVTLAALTEIEYIKLPLLSISAVRSLIESAYARPFAKATKTIVLEVGQINHEAQHALLKIFEEPPVTTRFILVMPSVANLLPTLVSRLHQPADISASDSAPNQFFADFLRSSYAERIALITELTKTKKTSELELLFQGVEDWLRNRQAGSAAARIHEWLVLLPRNGSAAKMLWEDIALCLPVVE